MATAACVEQLESRTLLTANVPPVAAGGATIQNHPAVTSSDIAPPTVTGLNESLDYVYHSAPLLIAPNLVLSEPDGVNIASASVTITNWQAGDRVDFYNSYAFQPYTFVEDPVAHTETVTITDIDSAAHYQTTLQSFNFWSVTGTPSAVERTVIFTVTDVLSNSASDSESLGMTSDAPVVSGLNASPNYVVQSAPLSVASNLVVSHPDGLNIGSATVTVTNWQAGDRLNFYNSYALQHTFVEDLVAHTATLTLTGSNTPAHYQTTLQSLVFWNVASNPVMSVKRLATFTVTDVLLGSDSETQSIAVTPIVNSTSLGLSGMGGTVNYSQNSAAVTLFPNLVVTDGQNLVSATVTFANWQAGDRVNFYNGSALQHTFVENLVAHTATLTLTGSNTPARYQTTLQSVVFWSVAGTLNTSTRAATLTLNDVVSNSATAIQNIAVATVDAPPLVQVNDSSTLTCLVNSLPIAVLSNALVSDPDSRNLTSLTIQITSGYQNDSNGQDALSFIGQFGITGSFNSVTGMLTLSGTSYAGNYRQVLRSVAFSTSGPAVSTATRTLTMIGTDDYAPTPMSSIPVTRDITVTAVNSRSH